MREHMGRCTFGTVCRSEGCVMSRRLDITVSDALYGEIIKHAESEGFANDRDHGKRNITVRALHYWLNKNGHSASVLRMTDAEYHEAQKIAGRGLPGTRKGIYEQTKE